MRASVARNRRVFSVTYIGSNTTHREGNSMEQVPKWLTDAVAAAGIAGVYVDFDHITSANDDDASPPEPTAAH